MSRYVENHLYDNELIVEVARRDRWALVGKWILGILFCWLLLIPLIIAIVASVKYAHTEFILTNKRLVRKSGVIHRRAFDVPLNKILNVSGKKFVANQWIVSQYHHVEMVIMPRHRVC